ncbi:hypothetical protein DICVIV_00094 [Dictyocaulus viviparus]|uniref:Uncharacterized protein n=1 Tax=Dictyocaulus viviparus TaxID=29172 RepID=A0A0D8YG45_DICVI|nr:hypothetical protein DICVIV_00094 [Dictyocaulus viviparus]
MCIVMDIFIDLFHVGQYKQVICYCDDDELCATQKSTFLDVFESRLNDSSSYIFDCLQNAFDNGDLHEHLRKKPVEQSRPMPSQVKHRKAKPYLSQRGIMFLEKSVKIFGLIEILLTVAVITTGYYSFVKEQMSNVRSSRVNDWYNHFLTKRAVPLRRDLPTNTSTEGYAVVIRRLRLTKNVTYHISCCFFDAKTSQFFGIPYRSAERRPTHNECELNDDLFFHCPHLDDAVSLVIEVVEKDTVTDNRPLSVAWGLLTVSGYEKTAPNYHSSSTSFDLQRIKLYPGSPKVLTFSPESHHTFAISGTLECSLYSHSRLLDAVDYFPEFCIIGNQYEIPGLLASESEPQLAAPIPMPHVPSSLDGISLSYGPHAERIEKLILDDINADRLYRENHAPSSKSEPMQVLERRLRVGVHNGFTFLFEPVVVHLSSIDEQFLGTHSLRRKSRRLTSCSDIRTEMNSLFVRPRVSLPKMIDDDRLVIVFALDYVFGIRANDKAILYSQNMIICWGAWQPFSNHSQLYENGHLQASVPLIGGPRPNPDESLCFKNLLHLFHRDDSIFIESAPKITIQFNFILDDTNPLNLSSRPQHQMSDSSPTTPAPQHEYVEEKAVKRNVERSSGRIQFQSNSFDTVHHSEQLPVVETKKPTKMASELHEKIDRVIEQESPRQNLPMIYALPLMETRPSNVTRSSHSVISNVPVSGVEFLKFEKEMSFDMNIV